MILNHPALATVQDNIRQVWRWRVVPSMLRRDPDALLAALVVADASLDAILLAAEYIGNTAGERLQNASNSFSDYASIRAARHIRHQAVHQLDYRLCWCTTQSALAAYARALWEHGVDLHGIWYPDDDMVDGMTTPVLLFSHTQLCGKGTRRERTDAG